MERDRLGRRRRPGQERGLRPLFPDLPDHWTSKVLRVAMSQEDWRRFDDFVRVLGAGALTQARAHGQTLSALMGSDAAAATEPGPLDWMDWERRKAVRLLRSRW